MVECVWKYDAALQAPQTRLEQGTVFVKEVGRELIDGNRDDESWAQWRLCL